MTKEEYVAAKRLVCPTEHPRYGVDADTKEWGLPPQQGKDDLSGIIEELKSGEITIEDVIWNHARVYQRNGRVLDKLWSLIQKKKAKRFRKLEVHIIWGEPGIGKTKQVFEEHGDNVYTLEFDDHRLWFDGYNCESVVLFDDFYGQVKYSELLRLWDGYCKRLNVKGSHAYANWDKVYVTSNNCPCKWYKNPRAWDKGAFRRRITSVTKLGNVPDCDHEEESVLDHDADV